MAERSLLNWCARSLTMFALVSFAAPVQAQPKTDEIARAHRLFAEATDHEERGQWALAAEKLRQAIAIKETPGLRFHLAHARKEQGQLVQAAAEYKRAKELIDSGISAPDVEALLGPALTEVQARIAKLTLVLEPRIQAATLAVNQADPRPLVSGKRIGLNPGKHQLTVRAPHYKPFTVQIALKDGDEQTVRLALEREAPPADTQPSIEPDPEPIADDGVAVRTYVVVGELAVGVVGMGIGIAYLLEADAARERATSQREGIIAINDSENACSTDQSLKSQCSQLGSELQRASRADTLATLGFMAGGLGLAAAVATWLLWEPDKADSASYELWIDPGVGGVHAGVSAAF